MNKKLLLYLPYIHEYLYEILKARIELKGFVLYGSIISDEMTRTSDIDIKIFVHGGADIKAIEDIENKINKKIISDNLSNLLHSIIAVKPDPEHIADGILLYGKPIQITAEKEKLAEMEIITYDTTDLDKNTRVSLAIRLFGHKTKRKENEKVKIYETQGLIELYEGKPLRNAILINTKDSEKISQILKDLDVAHKTASVYLPRFSEFVER